MPGILVISVTLFQQVLVLW